MDTSPLTPAQTPRTRKRGARTPDDRFATWLRRLRWPVVIVWILAIVALHGLSGSLSKVTNDGASAYLPASAASTKVVLLQQAPARCRNPDDPILRFDEPPIVCVLPNGKFRARRTPGGHYLFIAPLALRHPIEKIEDQSFYDSVSHGLNIQWTRVPPSYFDSG